LIEKGGKRRNRFNIEGEEQDESNYLSSSEESKANDMDDEIDVEKLDFEERALLARVNALKQYLP